VEGLRRATSIFPCGKAFTLPEQSYRSIGEIVAMVEVLTILAVLVPLFVVLHDDEVTILVDIAPFNVPVSMEDGDYAIETIKNEIRREMVEIVLMSGGTHKAVPRGIINESIIEVIAELTHLNDAIQTVKLFFGVENHYLLVSVIEKGGKLKWHASMIRMPAGPVEHFNKDFAVVEYDEAVAAVAQWAMRQLDPLTLLKYEYAIKQNSSDIATVWAELKPVAASYGNSNVALIENLVGMMHLHDGRAADAEMAFSVALQSAPDFDEAELNLAVAKAGTGDRAGSLAILTEAATAPNFDFWMSRKPMRAAALGLKGLVADNEGDAQLALASVQEAVDVDPQLPEAHEMAAAVLRGRGFEVLARYHEKEAISLRTHQPPSLPRAFLDTQGLRELLPPM
jgi:tetratricopeptide (TPR) repeat protein